MALRTALQRTRKELAALREILLSVNATADLRTILNRIAQTTTRVMRVNSTSIYLLERETQRLILKATTGLFPLAVDHSYLNMGEGLTGWAAQHRQVVAVRDAQRDPRFHEIPDTRERPFKSLMAVPLVSQDRVIGAMNVQTYRRHTWTPAEIEFVSLIGEVVAGLLERAMLQEESERKMRELQAVAEVSRAVIAPLYLDDTLRVVAEMGARAVNAQRCSVLLLDEAAQAYQPRAVWDAEENAPPEPAWMLNAMPLLETQQVQLQRGDPVIVQRANEALEGELGQWAARAELHTLLCVPMKVRERLIGLLNMWSRDGRGFGEAQIALCTTLANQIALAIENAHLIGNAAIVREMNHRVKNNLQNVVMLLQMQLHEAEHRPSAKELLQESINRIMTIAAVHDALAQEGLRLVNVKDVLMRVAQLTRASMTRPDLALSIEVCGDALRLSSRAATALALCVNELLQNAIEHAFPGRSQGSIEIRLIDLGGELEVEVRDDGVGIGELPSNSLGLNIVEMLVREDLRGVFTLRRDARGTVATIRAPFRYVDLTA
ncbi:MAG: GAF domain-containing protein [Thermoflexales bacterium]|nr:GAF domain-containing protein [Thermoflexales bacterium]MCX7937831.1 GAF domain-containing protein [Thermoflexales bacterium]MDW8053244.1 GAF domain-containing protein [Anaerolineae bacterium]